MVAFSKPPTDVAGYDPTRDADGFRWDPVEAARVCDFFPAMLCHTKGFSGRFELEVWQKNWLATLFGWKRKDGTRRYRECFGAVPRKNGKTNLAAGIALYCLLCDHEQGSEVYSAAFSRQQASLIFEPAAQMVRANGPMSRRCHIVDSTKTIRDKAKAGFYRAIPSDAAATHGFNASCVLFDELHTQTSRDLYDVLKTSQGARKQPLFASITTAGHNRHSICYEVWDYARNVRDGNFKDPHFLPVIYELGESDDWKDSSVWHKCNPNYGISISKEFLEEEFKKASLIPAYENTFKNLYLNQWTEQATRWLSMEMWDSCGGEMSAHDGMTCWCGLDLSTTTDLSAFVMVFPVGDCVDVECVFWIPSQSMRERSHRDRVPYEQWVQDGLIRVTDGGSTDYDTIRRDINELGERFHIRQIAADKWNATQIAQQLTGDGFDVGFFGQGVASMSAPSKELERLLVNNKLRHGDNPVLRWMANNVAVYVDSNENLKPAKDKSTERIDGIVALIMGLGSWSLTPDETTGSLFLC